ncbi:ABC transporter ATP-binding protein [Glaciihabitans sp. INWT7]|uniref:ABC transporter ATP-binding protein n=1 Tax=Glaciihabitans sp. INWT7 TaxID=2596912 RepID=UPI001625D55E|nr:ABC transporter ATP-binding protein [Glaciihabitans sp. INWT7]QNE47404.1 ABC transporter ATP-binding protein [Glaciihabitans sp. INWT7]
MTAPAIQLTGLSKNFGTVHAVVDVDLRIDRGEVVALLGPNGAGKSTTIDLALGLSHPTAGTARLFEGDPRAAIVDGRVGAMLQGGALLPDLTVAQTVALVASAHRAPLPVEEALERAGIRDLAARRVSKLSGGQLQRARFAVAVVSDPQLLILDEPTAAMDVESRRDFWLSMRQFTAEGRTVVFATHYLDEADSFADRIVIMGAGRVVADGTPAEVKSVVSGRTIRFEVDSRDADAAAAAIPQLPGVRSFDRRSDRFSLRTDDSDLTLRALLTAVPAARDIEITAHTMDDAFLALTSPTPQSSAQSLLTKAV